MFYNYDKLLFCFSASHILIVKTQHYVRSLLTIYMFSACRPLSKIVANIFICIYYLQDAEIIGNNSVKELGVVVNDKFKMGHQCVIAIEKANRMLGLIKKSVSSTSKDVILPMSDLILSMQYNSGHFIKIY